MKSLLLLAAACLGLSMTAAAVNVTVSQPGNNQQVGSPFTLIANASSNGHQIVGWHVYLDGNNVYTAGVTPSITASISASPGNHQLVTRAWDNTGAYGDVTETNHRDQWRAAVVEAVAATACPHLLAKPSVFNNIRHRGNWCYCHDPRCAGGSGEGTYWMAQHQGSPSRRRIEHGVLQLRIVWGTLVVAQKLGANNNVHNFLWDFWVYVDSAIRRSTVRLWSSTPSSSSTAITT